MVELARRADQTVRGTSRRPRVRPLTHRSKSLLLWRISLAGGDVAVIAIALVLGAVGRSRLHLFSPSLDVNDVAQSVGVYIALGWMLANLALATYSRPHLGVGTTEYTRILSAAGLTAGAIGIVSYLAKFPLSRGFFVLTFVIGVPLLLLWRYSARRILKRARIRGSLATRAIISGSPIHVDAVTAVLQRERWLGYQIVGALLPSSQPVAETPGGLPVLGSTSSVAEVAIESAVDAIVFTEGAFPSAAEFQRIGWALEGSPIDMVVVPSLTDVSAGRVTMRPVGGLPLVHVEQPRSLAASRGLKRAFDLVGASLILLVTAPLMLLAALAVRLEDGGPILFRQRRVGHDGLRFDCLKFRSMVVDAEAQRHLLAHLNDSDGVLFKLENDPRITRIGRLLRRFSIDEMPQLVNVLRGDMSLVGPRPALPAEVEQYGPDVERRLHVRPGMTGLWQVSGRSDLSWEDAVRLDLYYVDNWSILQDLQIVGRTVHAVISGNGAY